MAHYDKDPSLKDQKRFAKFLAEDEELEVITGYGSIFLRQKFIIRILFPGAIFIIGATAYAYFTKINLAYGLISGLIIAVLFSFFLTWLTKITHRYILTTRRLILREGIFNLKVQSTLYDKITHIEIDQGLIDRLFLHHGIVIINSAGGNRLILKYVEYPMQFKNELERLIHIERKNLIEEADAPAFSSTQEYS